MDKGDELIRACNLVRANGYAIVTQTQADWWDRWLRESHAREMELHDQAVRLIGGYGLLLDRATLTLAPSRPRWLREARRWWNNSGWAGGEGDR